MDDNSEELAFVVEDAKEQIIVPAIETVLKNKDFDQVKVDQWTDTICESIMKGLVDLQKPFKYIGKCLLEQITQCTYVQTIDESTSLF